MIYILVVAFLLLILALLIVKSSGNKHSIHYQNGVRFENSGQYNEAIQNFLEAKNELGKVKNRRKQVLAINSRIKTLHALIAYESNFQKVAHHGIA